MSDNKKLVEQGWDAFFRRDLDACLAAYTDDAEVVLPGAPPMKGKEAIRAAWQMYMAALDEKPTKIRHIAEGDTVVTEWTTVSTHKGPLMMPTGESLPATGKTITNSGATVQDVKNGKVERQVFYFDNVALLQQLGIMPAVQGASAS